MHKTCWRNAALWRAGFVMFTMFAHSTVRAQLNDNDPTRCEAALIAAGRLVVTALGESHVLFRSVDKAERYDVEKRRALGGGGLDVVRSVLALKKLSFDLPAVAATPTGGLVVEEIEDGRLVRIVRTDRDGTPSTSSTFARSRWLTSLVAVSADAGLVATADDMVERLRILDTRTGQIVHEEVRSRAQDRAPMHVYFSPDPRYFTIRRGGMLITREVVDGTARVHAGTEVGEPMRVLGREGDFTVSMNALGEVAYLPKRQAFSAAYAGPVPLLLDLAQGPRFRRHFFAPETRDWTDFSGWASVDLDERVMVTSRSVAARGRQRAKHVIEVFDLVERRHVRTIIVPHPVTAMAVRETILAVGFSGHGGVRIYDLTRPQPQPIASVETPHERVDTVSLTSASTVTLGSRARASLYGVTFRP